MKTPTLTFACELEAAALKNLFSDITIIEQLKALRAQISLGILDFSPERVEVVKTLNKAGIPVIAWLLLPKEKGYWFNLSNASQAASQYGRFKKWSQKNKLDWAGVGLDIEFDIKVAQQLIHNRTEGLRTLFSNLVRTRQYKKALAQYHSLVVLIRAEGYYVESYQLPFIVDERKVGAEFIQRSTGLVDLDVDREVLMLYSSFTRQLGPGFLQSYGRDAQGIGVGSTGGGVDLEGVVDVPPLDWEEFQRDLLLAYQFSDYIFIFSLEGCISQNFLSNLVDFDWNQSVTIPVRAAQRVDRYRKFLHGVLWVTAHPLLVLAGIFGLGLLLGGRKKRK